MRAPTDNEIMLAEQRLCDARRDASAAATRARTTIRDAMVKPGTLLGVAGAAGLIGYLFFKHPKHDPEQRRWWSAPDGQRSSTSDADTAGTASNSLVSGVVAFIMRIAMKQASGIGMGLFKQAIGHRARKPMEQGVPLPVRPNVTLH